MKFVLALTAALALVAPAAAAAGPAEPPVAVHATGQGAEQVLDYWTPGRIAAAVPLDTPSGPGPEGAPTASPAAQPPDVETDPARDTAFPERIHGKLFVTIGTVNASCSATVVTSRSRNLLLTAGHCVVEPGFDGAEPVWATNVLFVPGFRNGAAPFGAYPAISLSAPLRWAREPLIELDVGAVNLVPGPAGQIQDVLGARGVSFNKPTGFYTKKTRFNIFGYPGEPAAFYDAGRLIRCDAPSAGFEKFTGSPLVGPCSMKQGASGGGWVIKGGFLNSVVSHGACPISTIATCTKIGGTYFGETAYRLWAGSGGGISKGAKKKIRSCRKLRKAAAKQRCRSRAQTFKPVVRP
jgi:hypothetical protein